MEYKAAYRREQWKASITTIALLISTSVGIAISTPEWRTVIAVLFVLSFLMILVHYSDDAVRHRAYLRADSGKPLEW